VQELWESDYTSVYLQWPEEVFHGKEQAIDIHGIDYKLCSEKGMPPKEAMILLHDIILWARSEGMMIVGHNLMRFDIPFLVKEFERAGITFEVHSNEIVDTAMLVKAMQLGMMPGNTERACKYWQRVANMYAAGVYYSLDRWCVGRFNLDKKYELSVEDAHDAGTDCFATHCLVLELNAALEDFMD
jgi:DNA polymerase III epsilon subunit-like protein